MKNVLTVIKKLLANAMNAYRIYWHRENAKWRAMRQQEQKLAEMISAYTIYDWFSVFLLQAVRGCAVTVHFDVPNHPVRLFHHDWLKQDNFGNQFLVYRCRYQSGHGLQGQNFQHVLKHELDEIGAFWRWPPDFPVSVKLSPEYVAYIEIPFDAIKQIYIETGGCFFCV